MSEPTTARHSLLVHRDHRRTFENNRYVYAVVSRRSKGVSIGLNLNPDKVCNFDCVYCQVDRQTPPEVREVDVERLLAELETALDDVLSSKLFELERFRATPPGLRRLNDLAFSGDGEPTTCPEFAAIVRQVAAVKRRRGLDRVKMVLITNATRLTHPRVEEGLAILDANQGELWAKLDAGSDAYYQAIERTTVPLSRILENITAAARVRPIVIQAMFLRWHGEPPGAAEIEAFCGRLHDVRQAGGRISLVQVYTVARVPAEAYVTPLANHEIDRIVEQVRKRTGLAAEAFYAG